MTSIRSIVQRVKDDARCILDPKLVIDICIAAGHQWRTRQFDPVMTLSIMMLRVVHATSYRGALRIAGVDADPSALCRACRRLPLEVIQRLFLALSEHIATRCDERGHLRGHRIVMIDGSSSSVPDTPQLQKAFGQPAAMKPGCGFPVIHLLALFDQYTGTIIDLLTHRNNTHDMAHAVKLHPMLEAGDILLGDRGFCSYAHLALLLQDKLHGMFRLHQRQIASFKRGRKSRSQLPKDKRTGHPTSRFVRSLGKGDQIVEYVRPMSCPKWMDREAYAALPDSIRVREMRYRIKTKRGRTRTVTLVTTLLDEKVYPKRELMALYSSRWEVETRLREFKQTLGADVLHSKSVDGVIKDLWLNMMVYNLIREMMLRHAKDRACDPRRMSFIDARDVMRYARRGDAIANLVINKPRPGRDEPRVIKRRKDRYRIMTRPRETVRQALELKVVTP